MPMKMEMWHPREEGHLTGLLEVTQGKSPLCLIKLFPHPLSYVLMDKSLKLVARFGYGLHGL